MSLSFASALSGAALGGALTYAAVSQPRIILDQFAFKDMHMLRAFMTATAGSAVLTSLLSRFDLFTPYVRPPVSLRIFSRYDGNVLGGFMIGTGMALTGACPGSVIPQLATGVPSAAPAFLGALSGGLLWVTVGEEWLTQRQQLVMEVRDKKNNKKNDKKKEDGSKGGTETKRDMNTLHGRLGVKYSSMLLIYVAACLSVVVGSTALDSGDVWFGLKSGLGISLAQAVSMLATGNALCSSGAFEETARWMIWAVQRTLGKIDGSAALPKPPPCSNAGSMFAVGEFVGATLVARALGTQLQPVVGSIISDVRMGKLFAGGVALGFGARLANGCTSGHGISGMSAMSVASLITVATMFGGGMAVAAVL